MRTVDYRVLEAVFAEYGVPIPSIWQSLDIFNSVNFMLNYLMRVASARLF